MHTLGCADDAALLDSDKDVATARVTSIAAGSRDMADMEINVTKTECMRVCTQGRVTVSEAEMKKTCKFKCNHVGCGWTFANAHGLKCHQGKCRHRDVHLVDSILDVRGETGSPKRQFLVRWAGYGPEHDQWVARKNIYPAAVNEFLQANGLYEHDWPGARCPWCDLPCKNKFGVKVHQRTCGLRPVEQEFSGRVAEKKAKTEKLAETQKEKQQVKCETKNLANAFIFKHLGALFVADHPIGQSSKSRWNSHNLRWNSDDPHGSLF